ncbi:hypothetical protein [Steroidobacter cummioxidans]|uniref:hypothetical protein n=1 Tax=Steroidobacter cummioxidans TaxID=1803913 RepID=UPI0012906E85|nr:hypothetical protein [Steroidobacter cummioxidans]
MWIVFGWDKEQKVLGEVATAYCYDCRRESEWLVSRESEWVTFSAIRVFRFICKHRLHCGGCTAVFPLTNAEFKEIDSHMRRNDSINGTDLHADLVERIETEQLANKTPLQLKFIRESMEAQRQYQSAIEAQNERDA